MKKYIIVILGICLVALSACDKEPGEGYISTSHPSYSDRIFLRVLEQTDSTVTLNWTVFDSECFSSYYILRGIGTGSENLDSYSNRIATVSGQTQVFYTDRSQPLASELIYQVYVYG